MANRMIEGFDTVTGEADLDKGGRWTSISGVANLDILTGRVAGNCLEVIAPSAAGAVLKTIPAASGITIGFAFKIGQAVSTNIEVLSFLSVSTLMLELNLNTSMCFFVSRNGTTLSGGTVTPLAINTWYYIEWQFVISDTVGTSEIRINGVNDGSATGLDTRNGTPTTVNRLRLGSSGTGAGGIHMQFDDVYLNDNSGGVDDTFWGDIRVIERSVDGVGNKNQFTPSTGSNWQNVDDSATPDDDTTYNESSTVNHIDSMTTVNLGVTGTIKGIEVLTYARKTDAGAGSLAPLWRIGGTDYAGTGVPLSTSYSYNSQLYRVSPATSAAWTTTEFDGAELGYKRTA